jgi:hypothetical protein
VRVTDSVETEPDRSQDRHGVLSAVDEMREHIPRVAVTPDTLQGTPYWGKGGKEAEEARMRRVAPLRITPTVRI